MEKYRIVIQILNINNWPCSVPKKVWTLKNGLEHPIEFDKYKTSWDMLFQNDSLESERPR